jgi:hypothetical protein
MLSDGIAADLLVQQNKHVQSAGPIAAREGQHLDAGMLRLHFSPVIYAGKSDERMLVDYDSGCLVFTSRRLFMVYIEFILRLQSRR